MRQSPTSAGSLFDHLVDGGEELRIDFQAERLGRLEIDHEGESVRSKTCGTASCARRGLRPSDRRDSSDFQLRENADAAARVLKRSNRMSIIEVRERATGKKQIMFEDGRLG